MNRRAFVTGLGAVLAAPPAAEAQPTGNVPRIGMLYVIAAADANVDARQAFREALRDLGWIEGQNILVEERYANGQYDRLSALAAELVRLKVQVIVAISTPEIRAAKQATSTIPIVMVIGADPVAEGFIESVRRPGGNITGAAFAPDPAIAEKYLEFLREDGSRATTGRSAYRSRPARYHLPERFCARCSQTGADSSNRRSRNSE